MKKMIGIMLLCVITFFLGMYGGYELLKREGNQAWALLYLEDVTLETIRHNKTLEDINRGNYEQALETVKFTIDVNFKTFDSMYKLVLMGPNKDKIEKANYYKKILFDKTKNGNSNN